MRCSGHGNVEFAINRQRPLSTLRVGCRNLPEAQRHAHVHVHVDVHVHVSKRAPRHTRTHACTHARWQDSNSANGCEEDSTTHRPDGQYEASINIHREMTAASVPLRRGPWHACTTSHSLTSVVGGRVMHDADGDKWEEGKTR